MVAISLVPVSVDNWKACIALSLDESQAHFLPSNVYSIAEAQFYPDAHPLALCNEQQQIVGFALYGRESGSGTWKIFRFMIDHAHQHKGYGRAAMHAIIAHIVQHTNATELRISYQRGNEPARRLYTSIGFIEHEEDNGHYIGILPLNS